MGELTALPRVDPLAGGEGARCLISALRAAGVLSTRQIIPGHAYDLLYSKSTTNPQLTYKIGLYAISSLKLVK